jgi:RNA polymerase sigma-70 factor (ECF subfamily)
VGIPVTRLAPFDGGAETDQLRSLVASAKGGDRAAIRALLKTVAPVVARAARRVMGRDNPDAEDVAQQALAAFVDGLPTFREESTVVHFAERIAVYRAMTARRDGRVRQRFVALVDDEDETASVPASGPTLDGALAERDRRELLLEALETLPPPQAEALALHFLFDHTIREIAGMIEVPVETVRSRLRLGRAALRASIVNDARLAALLEEGP